MRTYSTDIFVETKKKVRVTFSGWDGKSYNGEARICKVYVNQNLNNGKEYVRAYFKGCRCYHLITDKKHPVSGERMVEFFTYFEPDDRL